MLESMYMKLQLAFAGLRPTARRQEGQALVEYALSLPRAAVAKGSRPKAVMEVAFNGLIPDAILRRTKLAFQDGLGLKRAIADTYEDPAVMYRRTFSASFPGLDS